jgi:predicted RNA-binding Zn ribbon-like protein
MYTEIRDGFKFRGGHIALDLTATLIDRNTPEQKDLLGTVKDLTRWLKAAGMEASDVSSDNLAVARELRELVHRLVIARLNKAALDDRDRERLNSLAREGAAPELTAGGEARWRGGPRALLSSVAAEAIWVLGNDRADRLRQCAGEGCFVLFYDTSRAGERRWCSMTACGNKAKAEGFRKRKEK